LAGGRLSAALGALLASLPATPEDDHPALAAALSAVLDAVSENRLRNVAAPLWAHLASALTHARLSVRLAAALVLPLVLFRQPLAECCDLNLLSGALCATLTSRCHSPLTAPQRLQLWRALLAIVDFRKPLAKIATRSTTTTHFPGARGLCSSSTISPTFGEKMQIDSAAVVALLESELFEQMGNAEFANVLLQVKKSFCWCSFRQRFSEFAQVLERLEGEQCGSVLRLLERAGGGETDFANGLRICALRLCAGGVASEELLAAGISNCADFANDLRNLLFRGLAALWRRRGGGALGEACAQYFAAFFRQRLAEPVGEAAVPCVAAILQNCQWFSESVVSQIVEACARALFRSQCVAPLARVMADFSCKFSEHVSAKDFRNRLAIPLLGAERDGRAVRAPWGSWNAESQIIILQTFGGMCEIASDNLRAAWLRVLAHPRTHVRAAETLVQILKNVGGKAFSGIAAYYSFLGAALFRQPFADDPALLCRAIADPSFHFAEMQNSQTDCREFALLAFEGRLREMLLRGAPEQIPKNVGEMLQIEVVRRALLLLEACGGPREHLSFASELSFVWQTFGENQLGSRHTALLHRLLE
jgi:hypothetical protein